MNQFFKRGHLLIVVFLCATFVMLAFQLKPVEQAKKQVTRELADTLKSFPTIMVDDANHTSVPLGMNKLSIDIQVVGNIAVTTLDMTFFNNESRVLEGELYFPLAAGQTVSRFAMEVNGNLREGVVVEKEQGRVAFESTVRQKIDPGLLEWSNGNNFKARVFPIPANGEKRILVAYSQELTEMDGQLNYKMPLKFNDKLKEYNVNVTVFKQKIQPVLQENEVNCFRFDQWNENYTAEMKTVNVYANQPLNFAIPFQRSAKTLIEQQQDATYFYTVVHPKKGNRVKKLPHSLTLLWDVSNSAAGRNFEKETQLLDNYLDRIGNTTVELVTFSNEIHSKESFTITNGDANSLFTRLKEQEYDGGTQLGAIDFSQLSGEEIILSSDCLHNFGKAELNYGNKPVYVWNSIAIADPSNAQYIADKSHGQFIDLTAITANQALDKMTMQQLRFLGMEENENVSITTDRAQAFTEQFSIAGITKNPTTKLALKFGYDNEVTEVIQVDLNETAVGNYNGLISKIWAQQRIAELDLRYEKNKAEITRIGKKSSIVTRNTSLIVLDRIEDYVTHRIVPPQELRDEYDKQIAGLETIEVDKSKQHLEQVVTSFSERKTWWNTVFKPKPIVAEKKQKGNLLIENVHDSYEMNEVGVREGHSSGAGMGLGNSVNFSEPNVISSGNEQENSNRMRGDKSTESKEKAKGEIELANWDPQTPYLAKIKASERINWYKTYLSLKKEYALSPSFYIDVADFFIQNNEKKMALRILSNLAEMELENPQVLRILGHRLEQLGYYKLSIAVFEEVKNLRPEEPQSFRDLGLVYALNQEDQKAIDALYYVVSHSWDGRFNDIESLVAVEMNAIIANSTQTLNLTAIDPRLISAMPVDMRVVINWDTDNCDIDLWVTDPRGEKCYYSNKLTAAGGRISNDFTGGYGPEEFVIKNAIPGNYIIQANYFGNRATTITGATTIQVQLITNYGRKSQKTKEITRRLETEKEVIQLGTFLYKAS